VPFLQLLLHSSGLKAWYHPSAEPLVHAASGSGDTDCVLQFRAAQASRMLRGSPMTALLPVCPAG